MRKQTGLKITPKQSLGQNFLVDENIVEKIIREMHLGTNDAVIEIGPGHGALTAKLAGNVRHLLIVEIDGRMIESLREQFAPLGVEILHQDFLETDLAGWRGQWDTKLRLVGNLPYHLTSPILFKVFDASSFVHDITFTIQREVAQRLVAPPGSKTYGVLSVMTQFYGDAKLLFHVSPNCFSPKPKVTSSVVQIVFHDRYSSSVDSEIFRTVVRTAFGKRRKTLKNSLSYLPYGEKVLDSIVQHSSFSLEKRPEQLTLEQFIELAHHVENCPG